MPSDRTSHELIAHFDRPGSASKHAPIRVLPTRNIRWVLECSLAIGVLAFSTCVLIEFVYSIVAERDFTRAARAGALEATLPRANYQSVQQTVARRLASYPSLNKNLQISIAQNGSVARKQFELHDNDTIRVTVSADGNAVLPAWLRTLRFWRVATRIESAAERKLPGRRLGVKSAVPSSAGNS